MKMVLMDHSLYRDRLGRAPKLHISTRGVVSINKRSRCDPRRAGF